MIKEVFKSNRGKAAIIICDQCGAEARKPFKCVKDKKQHFCKNACSLEATKPGGARYEWMIARAKRGSDSIKKQYGSASPMSIPGAREKLRGTRIKRFGKEKAEQIVAKTKETNIEKYGVSCPFNIPEVRERSTSAEAQDKKLRTLISHGMWKSSKVEDEFYEELLNYFSAHDIERQVISFKWPIDFWVKSRDIYIQIDGVYWHGLDRPIDIIENSERPRDKTILRKWHTDREQNLWFHSENKRLLRFTDVEFRNAKRQNQVEKLLRDCGLISDECGA